MASLIVTGLAIIGSAVLGILFAFTQFSIISRVHVSPEDEHKGLKESDVSEGAAARISKIYNHIRLGAQAFLRAEYTMCMVFIVVFGAVVCIMTARVGDDWEWKVGGLTMMSFVVGGVTSILSGYIGMSVAVFSNARTTLGAMKTGEEGWKQSFNTAFRAGNVMGFALVGMGLSMLFIVVLITYIAFPFMSDDLDVMEKKANAKRLMECVSGYGLGGSCIALFGRVGGGIYTKAADVGADLAGKVVENIPEDDPRNPATIADNVGDNVGDVAGMGSDLFGSFAESSCAALVIASSSEELVQSGWGALLFPLVVSAGGIISSILTTFMATDVSPVRREKDVERVLKLQLFISSLLMTIAVFPIAELFLPESFVVGRTNDTPGAVVYRVDAFLCVAAGLWGGCVIGFVTEYFTSHSYRPVREVAQSCETGAATNVIYGLALGYKSVIIPILIIAGCVYLSFSLADMYGVALCALGMLGTLATCLSIDVYGPVCDNAGGIAEMAELPAEVRDKTDALDAAGNTTAAVGKGFAIGSAALVSLALFGGFVTRIGLWELGINILRPVTFSFLFIGAMLPYWFTAMTMKSVGKAAMEMVKEVGRQFATIPGLLEGTPGHGEPDHARCIKISTDASLREMIAPGLLVIVSPIFTGAIFGVEAVSGLLIGALTSGVQLAISQSNTGGAWDNAKKYVEKGAVSVLNKDGELEVQGKGTELHKAAVVGDTVGDPLKDTSGPALNILMKLMAIISLVFGDFFMTINNGRGALKIPSKVLQ